MEIETYIASKNLHTLFQPIVSLKRKSILGFEALSRGREPSSGHTLGYEKLHEIASFENTIVQLDRACRYNALHSWKSYYKKHPESLLFLNFDVTLLNNGVNGSGFFLEMVKSAGIPPENIVIELVERQVQQYEELLSFVETYRKKGFLFAIDDFGEAASNIERLFMIQPEVIKISRTLFHAPMYSETYGKSVLEGLVNLIASLGSLPLLEGVETVPQLYNALDCGIDVIQGFLISHPMAELSDGQLLKTKETLRMVSEISGKYRSQCIQLAKAKSNYLINEAKHMAMIVEMECVELDTDVLLHNLLAIDEQIECLYILSETGVQISETHFRPGLKIKNALFKPAKCGDDHSEKDYFLYIKAGSAHYFSSPYISQATGSYCSTISIVLTQGPLAGHILCIDFATPTPVFRRSSIEYPPDFSKKVDLKCL
ncbi:EAL domain-containing protein [Gracilinema caldarium]|uniref:Diguanylate phosphodiesterase n=1 Tax=Gracilinema caldarium (strain ATCC 51460 / DSM 7334 / H1) TaxID=744872 RepID=F8F0W4_GRAC1|nr:EAL domain-containing protein [Gracilinema caldarium]AEJ20250.1 diguanylate phosphodiesterase [Gracilinema caldarium DSM 7334]